MRAANASVRGRGGLLRRAGAVLWPSFFSAAVATMVCFAFVDPADLEGLVWLDLPVGRQGAYSMGFFGFWSCTLASSLFTAILLRNARLRKAGR